MIHKFLCFHQTWMPRFLLGIVWVLILLRVGITRLGNPLVTNLPLFWTIWTIITFSTSLF